MTDGRHIDAFHTLQGSHSHQWIRYTPVLTPSSGTLTSYTSMGSYLLLARKLLFLQVQATITNPGTSSGTLKASLPVAFDPKNTYSVLQGIESTNGLPAIGYLTSTDTMNTSVYVFGNAVSVTVGSVTGKITQGQYSVDIGSGNGNVDIDLASCTPAIHGTGTGSITFTTYAGGTNYNINLTGFYAIP